MEEDRLGCLEEYYEQGVGTREQAARYEEIEKPITRNRSIPERMADR
ncbi:MAG: hypothetical protein WKF67_12730 [Rubrobacteraceae bacterium]